jgi:hypothetical protein
MGNAEIETLNNAIEHLLAGESPADISKGLGEQISHIAPLLETGRRLSFLSDAPLPSPEQVRTERAAFMQELANSHLPAVSPSPFVRLKEWAKSPRQHPKTAKNGGNRMLQEFILKAAMIMTMVLGSTGAGTLLAKESLPGTLLYPVKIALEHGQESITTNPADKANFELIRAQNRLQELVRLMDGLGDPDGQTTLAAQVHLEKSLQLAAGLSDEEMIPLLERIRQATTEQVKQWSQYENANDESVQQQARLVVQMLTLTRAQAEEGLRDPQMWRLRISHGQPTETPESLPTPNPDATEEPGGIISGTLRSGCETSDCEPEGDQNQYGPQPEQPGPGQPGGNPDGSCLNGDCEPDGDQNQYGRQSEESIGSSSDICTTPDCEPGGNQNQYGSQSEESSGASQGSCTNGNCQQQGSSSQESSQSSSAGTNEPAESASNSSSSSIESSHGEGQGSSNESSDTGSTEDHTSDSGSSPKSNSDKGGKGK